VSSEWNLDTKDGFDVDAEQQEAVPAMTNKPSPGQLWNQAGGDEDRYRELMRQHGHLIRRGEPGFEEASATLPCGYPGLPVEYAKCRKIDCRRKVRSSVAYCCRSCADADGDRAFELEPYSPSLHPFLCHTSDCDQRNVERGEVSVWEM